MCEIYILYKYTPCIALYGARGSVLLVPLHCSPPPPPRRCPPAPSATPPAILLPRSETPMKRRVRGAEGPREGLPTGSARSRARPGLSVAPGGPQAVPPPRATHSRLSQRGRAPGPLRVCFPEDRDTPTARSSPSPQSHHEPPSPHVEEQRLKGELRRWGMLLTADRGGQPWAGFGVRETRGKRPLWETRSPLSPFAVVFLSLPWKRGHSRTPRMATEGNDPLRTPPPR